MVDLNWMPLRLNVLPVIHQQTQHVLDMFLSTRAQILEGDILGLQTVYDIRDKVPIVTTRSGKGWPRSISFTPGKPWTRGPGTSTRFAPCCIRSLRDVRSLTDLMN